MKNQNTNTKKEESFDQFMTVEKLYQLRKLLDPIDIRMDEKSE